MIKFENTGVMGWEDAIRGMRNPMNSWEKSDSLFISERYLDDLDEIKLADICGGKASIIGENDMDLMKRLRNAGTDHRKFMRMITVYVDITAPLYWWKEFDTYKVGTVANSCSTMHKIHAKEFTLEDFSCEHLLDMHDVLESEEGFAAISVDGYECHYSPKYFIQMTCDMLNHYRESYLETCNRLGNDTTHDEMTHLMDLKKKYWWQMIQLLPSSYNQKRTVMMNYEVLANIYKSRRNHKLDEWAEHKDVNITDGEKVVRTIPNQHQGFCDWIKTLPYSELITGEEK